MIGRSKQKQSKRQAERLDPVRNMFIPYSWHSVRNVILDPVFFSCAGDDVDVDVDDVDSQHQHCALCR